MERVLIECVPNFSEGRDLAIVKAIGNAITRISGVQLLKWEMDQDHNRSVFTLAGAPLAIAEGVFAGAAEAVKRIDLRKHSGVHPRMGAADVIPFIPLSGSSLAECVEIAHRFGERLWKELGVPVYFYEAAANGPERERLEQVRKGGFEHPALLPDLGGPSLHASAGASIVGARKLLIAWNINLNTADLLIAREIARQVRTSSGGLPYVKALGVAIASRGLVQVSMNLTDFETTSMRTVFDSVRDAAQRHGVSLAGSEIIGLLPQKALSPGDTTYLQFENFHPGQILENRIRSTKTMDLFDEIAEPRSPHAGGAAAAIAGALAAALGSKVCGVAHVADTFAEQRRFFSKLQARDAEALGALERAGFSDPVALERAAAVPLETFDAADSLLANLRELAKSVPTQYGSEVQTAVALADAARTGALATARANIILMEPSEVRTTMEQRLRG